jgi:predicted nucleotidyltransferase
MATLYEDEILRYFIYNPMRHFGVRELSRITKRNTKTVMKYLKDLVKRKIIVKIKEKNKYSYYESNRLSGSYKIMKSNYLLNLIAETGLFDLLEKELNPKAIVLFGSVQKGTYTQDSDIDIFILGEEKKIDLRKFEKKLGHKIELYFEKDIQKLSEGLKNNIVNGYTLQGRIYA